VRVVWLWLTEIGATLPIVRKKKKKEKSGAINNKKYTYTIGIDIIIT